MGIFHGRCTYVIVEKAKSTHGPPKPSTSKAKSMSDKRSFFIKMEEHGYTVKEGCQSLEEDEGSFTSRQYQKSDSQSQVSAL